MTWPNTKSGLGSCRILYYGTWTHVGESRMGCTRFGYWIHRESVQASEYMDLGTCNASLVAYMWTFYLATIRIQDGICFGAQVTLYGFTMHQWQRTLCESNGAGRVAGKSKGMDCGWPAYLLKLTLTLQRISCGVKMDGILFSSINEFVKWHHNYHDFYTTRRHLYVEQLWMPFVALWAIDLAKEWQSNPRRLQSKHLSSEC